MPRRRRQRVSTISLILLLLVLAAIYFFRIPLTANLALPGAQATLVIATPQGVEWGHRAKTAGCAASGGLPDAACTPGDIFDVTTTKICESGYARSVRDVPESEKADVYQAYGIASHLPGQYEVDHLVSLELGGSNDISNLWPELASPTPGFHEKDKVENYLHDQVCSGAMSLQDAQVKIATNWLAVYDSMPK